MSGGTASPARAGAAREEQPGTEARRTRRVLLITCAAVVAARLVFAFQPLRSDEAGYLLVARSWAPGGEFLYGDYHVDRPPLLIAIFRVAALSDWDGAVRLVAIPFTLVAMLALARAGFLLAGHRGARWSAVVGAALVSSPALAANGTYGELLAVPFVAASVALTLEAWRRASGRAQAGFAVAAGVLAGAAPLVKQNFVDGLLFAGVLVVADSVRRRRTTGRSVVVAVGVAGGALVPLVLVGAWAASHGIDPARLWTDLVGFRGAALSVIWDGSLEWPLLRAGRLVVIALVSGMVALAWSWVRWARARRWRCSPEEWAVTGSLAFAVTGMALGGSFWQHYLLQLTVGLSLAAGLVAAEAGRAGAAMRRWASFTVASSVLSCVVIVVVYATVPYAAHQERVGTWLAEASAPGDTALVAYGSPGILEAADLDSPYPYLWSLPMRTLDPSLDRLADTIAGSEAPTWVVQAVPLNAWGIDADHRVRDLVEDRYDQVGEVCGHRVLLRSGLNRDLPPPPDC